MPERKKHLLILDAGGALSPGIRGVLASSYEVADARSRDDLLDKVTTGAWQGVLIGLGDDVRATLLIASRVKKVRPELPVLLLGELQASEIFHEAFHAHVDAIVNASDATGLDAALASRLGVPVPAA